MDASHSTCSGRLRYSITHYSRFPGAYRIELIAPTENGTIAMSSGVRLGVAPLPEPPPRHDTLVIAGGAGAREGTTDTALIDWITRASQRARRTVSICTGAYLLAAAGLLDNRRATTHWEYCDALARTYTNVHVEPDPVFIRDGNVWTSAGSPPASTSRSRS